MRVLIVDDEGAKVSRVREVLEGAASGVEVETCGSAHEALARFARTGFDLMILDIRLPRRAGEEAREDGGLDVLRALRDRRDLRPPRYVIGLTAFTELAERFADEFNASMWQVLNYRPAERNWEDQIARFAAYVSSLKDGRYECDLAVVTALYSVEFEAVLALDAKWKGRELDGDATLYQVGEFERVGQGPIRVVAASSVDMGMPTAAALAMKMIVQWRPRHIIMVGVAAGVKGRYGDILIADHVWDYGSGKILGSEAGGRTFQPAPCSLPLSPLAKQQLAWLASRREVLEGIRRGWTGPGAAQNLSATMGPMASGASVVADRSIIEGIMAHNRKLIGIEMEAYGVFVAARLSSEPQPTAVVMKSICDLGDLAKNDKHQRYAAYTSARFMMEFAVSCLG